jgi:hypothetical protein
MFKATAKLYDAAQKVSARVVRISVVAISEFLRHHLLLRLEVLHLLAELEPSLRHVQQKKLVLRICGGPRVPGSLVHCDAILSDRSCGMT